MAFYIALVSPTIIALIVAVVLITIVIITEPEMPDPPVITITTPDPTSKFPPPITVTPPTPIPTGEKDDIGKKKGGLDPLVIGNWHYSEVDTKNCISPRSFDYDNDFEQENFCYEIIGSIFVIDFHDGEGISHGYNMLNFFRTNLHTYTPFEYLEEFPTTCNVYTCYLWNDKIRNWKIDPDELTPYKLKIINWIDHPKGMDTYFDGMGAKRYIYGAGTNQIDGMDVISLKPTYWTMIEQTP